MDQHHHSSTQPQASPHRKWAFAGWIAALAWLATSVACLMYVLYGNPHAGLWKHWAAITWQLGQVLAIACFTLGMWQFKKHRHWQQRHDGAAPDQPLA
ncbi:hypothetical protein CLI92_11410 [Vandammella animalimorsus]|uniref:Uncharacterized protein n=1 Tax=Vandammella animalimorsus TaxID=2029117 RepID=A0A2A2AYQ5_9BURK|nr:hypothetical protein [Vandammella animalimorsus]RRD67733.1 hypothetical protein EII19_04300 [Comamonadaceae bacterium OH2310_COT-174]PAT32659.1 hypothetical protein CK626_02985 [Vandammella animalimorsus]PAT37626.1 hypothetical protein CK625_04940 [Vandammella animalimorsus]PAT43710.1 hypothetical protein CK621_02330 [Vandammella animalimorsus]PAX15967.1 hypothetical protein CLI92_11410 [Vandammella animalimorsus]